MFNQVFRILVLMTAVLSSFAVSKVNLYSYDLPIALILFISLFTVKKFIFPRGETWRLIEAFIFTLIALFTVITTGGINSPFFFLIYFLIFSLSILFEPAISLSTSMMIILLFIITTSPDVPFKSLIPIFSLAFLAPFALLLSQERIENERLKVQERSLRENTYLFLSLTLKKHLNSIKDLAENIRQDEAQAVKNQVKIMEKLIQRYEEQ